MRAGTSPHFAFVMSLVLAATLAGCSKKGGSTRPPVIPPDPAPVADSPQGLVRLFEWCWDRRDTLRYRRVFTSDFEFRFAAGDSGGDGFAGRLLDRTLELESATRIFATGGPSEPPADSSILVIDPTLQVVNDPRPGKNPTWHRQVLTNVDLTVITPFNTYRISGRAAFYTVRGDSALIPPDLAALGITPDATRWYMDRWDDLTFVPNPAEPTPFLRGSILRIDTAPAGASATRNFSWGYLKKLYRPPS